MTTKGTDQANATAHAPACIEEVTRARLPKHGHGWTPIDAIESEPKPRIVNKNGVVQSAGAFVRDLRRFIVKHPLAYPIFLLCSALLGLAFGMAIWLAFTVRA